MELLINTNVERSEMATKAQREAHRRYALKVVGELTHSMELTHMGPPEYSAELQRSGTWTYMESAHWSYAEIAAVLTKQGVFTPSGTTEWTPRLVAALLVWDAFLASETERLNLIQFIGDSEESAREFEGLKFNQQAENMSAEVSHAVKCADKELHEGDSGDEVMPTLTPAHQAAYREYALYLVQRLAEGPWNFSDVATALTIRTIPTLNGRPNWHPNQVQRLIMTGPSSWAERFEPLETAEGNNEEDDDSENL